MDYFRSHEYRRVKKDRTVQIYGQVFEVSAKLIDKTVELLFHADNPLEIEVQYQGASYGKAVPLNLSVNTRAGRDWSTSSSGARQAKNPVEMSRPEPVGGRLFSAKKHTAYSSPETPHDS
jgi:hypothetical protein